MIDQRLYIDGVLADIDDDTKITLDIKSNLLRDVSKIVSNATYTVKLPKTVHNQALVGHADKLNGGNNYPYKMHHARYFRNGVEIINDGRAVLLSIGDKIEITIIWGLYQKFSTLVSEGTTLNQLTNSDRILYQSKNVPDKYTDALNKNFFYAKLDVWKHDNTVDYSWRSGMSYVTPSGIGRGRTLSSGVTFGGSRSNTDVGYDYLQPSVKVSYLLDLIKQQEGVDFQFSDDALAYIQTLIIPLISRKSNELTFDDQFTASLPETAVTARDQQINITVGTGSNVFNEAAGTTQSTISAAADANVILDISAEWSWDNSTSTPQGHSSHSFGGSTTSTDNYSHIDTYLRMTVTSGAKSNDYVIGVNGWCDDRVPSGYKGIIRKKITGYGKIELKKGDTIQFHFTNPRGILRGTKFYGGTIKATLSSDENVPSGGYYPICYNLPKIKIIDFIKFLACVTGTFPMQVSDEGVVKFIPYNIVWSNLSKAVDWSNRLIPHEGSNKPKNIEYTVDEWCQHNWYKWKEDETVIGNYDGEIKIDNESIDTERDVFTFPFAATDGSNVPMWEEAEKSTGHGTFGGGSSSSDTTTDTTDSQPSYSACKDRILRLAEDSNGLATGVFDINMQDVLDDKYRMLAMTLNNAHSITENIIISDIELLNFDETKPVYLAQYGAYFAVTEIKASSNGTAEVTMLQLYIE